MNAMASPFPPELESRFSAVRPLGAGGFGHVWLANQLGLGRQVAIKLLNPELAVAPEEVERFVEEARITATLAHPAVVKVIDFGAVGGVPWIAYELLEGKTLGEMLAVSPLRVEEAGRLLAPVARGLAAAHERGIVHRDVKPDNVFVDARGEPRLTDFGIARWGNSTRVRTATGLLIGSPAFLAPELIEGADASPSSDVYALGITLFWALTGEPPFAIESLPVLLESHLRRASPRPSDRVPGLPAAADACVAAALAKSPARRYRDANAMAEALEALAASHPAARPSAPLATLELRPAAAGPSGRAARPSLRTPRASAAPGRRSAAAPTAPRALPFAAVAVTLAITLGAAFHARGPGGDPRPSGSPGPSAPPLPASASSAIPGAAERPLTSVLASFELFRGVRSVRVQVVLSRPLRVKLSVERADHAGSAVATQLAPPRPQKRYITVLTGLEPDTAYRAMARAGAERIAVQFRTAKEDELAGITTHLAEMGGALANLPARELTEQHLYLPESDLARSVADHPTPETLGRMLELAEAWDSAPLAEAVLHQPEYPAGSVPRMRMLIVAGRDGRRDISRDVEEWIAHADLQHDESAQQMWLQELIEHGDVVADGLARYRFGLPETESVARAVLAYEEDAAPPLLLGWLKRPERRGAALLALALCGRPELLAPLRAVCESDPQRMGELPDLLALSPLSEAGAMLLGDLRQHPTPEICHALSRRPRPQAAGALARLTEAGTPRPLRLAALAALGRQGDPDVFGPVLAALEDADPLVRRSAAWALARLPPTHVAREALRRSAFADTDVDGLAAWALGEIGETTDGPALLHRAGELAALGHRTPPGPGREAVLTRAALALLAGWRLDPAGARVAARSLHPGTSELLFVALEVIADQRRKPEEVDVLFPFAPFDGSHAIRHAGDVLEIHARNAERRREGDGGLVALGVHTEAEHARIQVQPALYRPSAWSPRRRPDRIVAPEDGPLLLSPLFTTALEPLADVDSTAYGSAVIVVNQRISETLRD